MTPPEPLWSDERIGELIKSVLMDEPNHTPRGLVRRVSYIIRTDYETERAAHLARVAELELDSVYLNEVAGPAIDEFQERDRQQRARIAELEAELVSRGEAGG